jgi:hypothetical protein
VALIIEYIGLGCARNLMHDLINLIAPAGAFEELTLTAFKSGPAEPVFI